MKTPPGHVCPVTLKGCKEGWTPCFNGTCVLVRKNDDLLKSAGLDC